MSEVNKFDNFIKNELGSFSSEVPPDLWEKIVQEREKRRPGGFWLFFLNNKTLFIAVGVMAAIMMGYSLISYNVKNTSLIFGDNKQMKINSISTNSGSNTQTSLPLIAKNNSGKLIENNKNSDELQVDKSVVLGIKQKNNSLHFTSKKKLIDQKNIENPLQISNENSSSSKSAEKISNSEKSDLTNSFRVENSVKRFFSGKIEGIHIEKEPVGNLRQKSIPNMRLPECPQIEKDAAPNKKYIEFYAGPDIVFRNFSDTSKSVYLQKRQASTKVVSAFSAGFRYSKVFKNGMGIKTGINYSQINEQFSFIQSNIVQNTYIIDPKSGDTTGSYTVSGIRKQITANRYHFVDIPLLIGYELGNGRLHSNISIGTLVNVYSWQKGNVLDSTFQPISITTGEGTSSPYQFKTNIGLALTGSIAMYYKLTEQVHLFAEPYFRYNLNTLSKNQLTFKQKYNLLGLHVGLRMDLNNY